MVKGLCPGPSDETPESVKNLLFLTSTITISHERSLLNPFSLPPSRSLKYCHTDLVDPTDFNGW